MYKLNIILIFKSS